MSTFQIKLANKTEVMMIQKIILYPPSSLKSQKQNNEQQYGWVTGSDLNSLYPLNYCMYNFNNKFRRRY